MSRCVAGGDASVRLRSDGHVLTNQRDDDYREIGIPTERSRDAWGSADL